MGKHFLCIMWMYCNVQLVFSYCTALYVLSWKKTIQRISEGYLGMQMPCKWDGLGHPSIHKDLRIPCCNILYNNTVLRNSASCAQWHTHTHTRTHTHTHTHTHTSTHIQVHICAWTHASMFCKEPRTQINGETSLMRPFDWITKGQWD